MVRRSAKTVDAPLPRTANEWADVKRILPKGSAEPGPFSSDRTPYMIEPVRAFSNPQFNKVVWIMASQMGKSTGVFNIIGHRLDDDPAPVLYVGPTQNNIRTVVEPKINEMLRSVPDLFLKMAKGKKNTKTKKIIGGVVLRMAWAGSATEMAADSAVLVFLDELDRMESSVKGEGDPLELAEARTGTYADGKVGVASTPTIGNVDIYKHTETGLEHWGQSKEVGSASWALWQEGTRHEWAWPCPECHEYFIPRLRNLHWDKDSTPLQAERSAHLLCPECGCVIADQKKNWMNSKGVFVSPGEVVDQMGRVTGTSETEGNRTASFWISGICSFSAKKSFGYLASKMVAAYRSNKPGRIQAVLNTEFGELFSTTGEAVSWEKVRDRCQPYLSGKIHEGIMHITCGVDVQKDRLVYAIRGWGENFESWLIKASELHGQTDHPEVWSKLKLLLDKKWDDVPIRYMAIDSGYQTSMVYKFCENYKGTVFPTKGKESLIKSFKFTDVNDYNDIKLLSFVPDIYKTWVVSRISWPRDEVGGWWVPSDVTEDYCRQMTSEKKIIKPSGGIVWVKVRKDNHYFDAEVLNRLLISIASNDNEQFFLENQNGNSTVRRGVRSKGVR